MSVVGNNNAPTMTTDFWANDTASERVTLATPRARYVDAQDVPKRGLS